MEEASLSELQEAYFSWFFFRPPVIRTLLQGKITEADIESYLRRREQALKAIEARMEPSKSNTRDAHADTKISFEKNFFQSAIGNSLSLGPSP